MNAVDKCVSLVKEINNAKTDFLPPYNQRVIDECISAIGSLNQDNQRDGDDPAVEEDGNRVLKIRESMMKFMKRCLLAYHNERLMRIKRLRWEFGIELPEEVTCNFSEREKQWFTTYCENMDWYMSHLNDSKGWDLTLHKTAPKRIYIQVKCTSDHGEYRLDDGTEIVLEKDSIHYLPFSQCEKLIQMGIFAQIMD
ncbi:DNA replication complex GINS protein PSF1-like [Brevipalpus obovatus]|uniref:DNA replication complex GINS protein PSF1-like n=1 Tax=Brevipalpus obovatus TaxID=246614 RepID=UPI003D9E1835